MFYMAESCAFSFDDLYQAANGRPMTKAEKEALYVFPQSKRNIIVGKWAESAGWQFQDRVGTDGVMYRAFWEEKPKSS